MSDFYEDMQSIATDLIGEFKQGTVQYVAVVAVGGPVDNPGPSTLTTYTVNAVVRGVAFRYIDGTSIVSTDLQFTISGDQPFVPDMKGHVTVDGVKHTIIGIMPKPAAGTPVAYTIIFRK